MRIKGCMLLLGMALGLAAPRLAGAIGHYVPGLPNARDLFVPPPGLYLVNYTYWYHADTFKDRNGATVDSFTVNIPGQGPRRFSLDTDEVFTEESPYRPRTPYNASKAGADHAVRAYFETFGLPVTITNCSNNYGPYQFPEKVIPLFTTNALDDLSLPMYASTQNKREWLHVLDHCEAIEIVLRDGRPGETYNVGSGIEATIEEIADLVLRHTGKPDSLKTIVPDRPGHDRRYLLDASKIHAELGWTPSHGWDEGLAETVAWYAANRAWWEPLKARAPVEESAWRG